MPHRNPWIRSFLVLLCAMIGLEAGEWRGWWVDAFHPGMKTPAEVSTLVAQARQAGINTLFVQVRKRGDALYSSTLEPKATDVSPPTFDPLAELLRLAHDASSGQQRIDVHAWIVTYNIWNSETRQPSQANHPYRLHPDWLTESWDGSRWDGSNYAFDPAHPEVQNYTVAVALDLLRYDIDGLHLDYVRYNGSSWGYHPIALQRFQSLHGYNTRPSTTEAGWKQFRRDQVTALLRRIHLASIQRKPNLRISAATITFAPGINSTTQWTSTAAYGEVFQDWRAWMAEGLLDLNIPMAYFRQGANGADWSAWSAFAKNHRYGRHVALGVATYLNTPSDSLHQLRSTRVATAAGGQAQGMVLYSYADPSSDIIPTAQFGAGLRTGFPGDSSVPLFSTTENPPNMPWKDSPQLGHLLGRLPGTDGATILVAGTSAREIKTDANGWFGCLGLPPGEVRITAQIPNRPMLATVRIQPGKVAQPTFWNPHSDDDGDGLSNGDELLWGSDPNQPSELPAARVEYRETRPCITFPHGPLGREFVLWHTQEIGVGSPWLEVHRQTTRPDEPAPILDLSPWLLSDSMGFFRIEIRWVP